jgi:hypothetical protein
MSGCLMLVHGCTDLAPSLESVSLQTSTLINDSTKATLNERSPH